MRFIFGSRVHVPSGTSWPAKYISISAQIYNSHCINKRIQNGGPQKAALTRQLLQTPVELNQCEGAGAGLPRFSTNACRLKRKHKRLDVEICRRLCVDGNDNNNDKTDRFAPCAIARGNKAKWMNPGISLYPFSLTCHCSFEVCHKRVSNTPTNMSCTFTSKFSS